MEVKVEAVAGLNQKRKYMIFYNEKPLIYCGKKEVPLIMTVIQNGSIKEDVPLEAGKQGRILKLIKNIKEQCDEQ